MRQTLVPSFLAVLACVCGWGHQALAGNDINVYSYRQPYLIQPALDLFTKRTGIVVNVLYLDKGLIERMKIEGENSPADIIISGDIVRLDELKQAGLTQAPTQEVFDVDIPAKFRDPDGQWYGLSMDARVIYASTDRVKTKTIRYEDLAKPEWKGKVCIRDGRHATNLGLFADMIAADGADATQKWMAGLKDNLVGRPNGTDRSQVEAIAAGTCDLALGNSTVLAAMLTGTDAEAKKAAEAVQMIYPAGRGTFGNISGMAMAKFAPNKINARALMTFLATKPAQLVYAQEALEFPVVGKIKPQAGAWYGSWLPVPDAVPMSDVLKHRDEALALVDKTGFNDGPEK